jgi:hypothetical protein
MTETNNREVNDTDVEEVEVADDVEETEEGEETVIPPVEDTEEGVPAEEGESTEESPESSPEETTDEEPATEPDPSTFTKKEPAPVAGETPKEKALRLEVQRLKGLHRKDAINDLVGKGPAPEVDNLQQLRDIGYSDEEISNMEKAIDVIAQKKGYVKAEQSYQATVNSVVESFIDSHPEYKPENDPEDVRWTRFEGIVKSGVYNLSGKTPKQLNDIFKRIHRDVSDELGEADVVVEVKRQAAQAQKIKSVSHSGGTKSAPVRRASTIDPNVRGMFKGFDDEDLE